MPGTEAGQPSAADDTTKPPCTCVIAHVQNDEERDRVQAALDNALKTNHAPTPCWSPACSSCSPAWPATSR